MSATTIHRVNLLREGASLPVQILAWMLGIVACVIGMLDLVAEWKPELAQVQFVTLVIAPILFMMGRSRRIDPAPQLVPNETRWIDWGLCLLAGVIALNFAAGVGIQIGDLPPAYHDEYSYLFQAKTLLAGRISFPGSPVEPELFDQMHVLNEGRMASRYYPGTGFWLAPFVAIRHPYLGQWLAFAAATMLIYWIGYELGGRETGLVASLAMAFSPGIRLFSNLLLAHLPTLLALCMFLLGMVRWRRTRCRRDAWTAGVGLACAMLCRPVTAAAFGLPFGIDVLLWLVWNRQSDSPETVDKPSTTIQQQRIGVLLGLGVPLLAGWAVMLCYNHDVTGQWLRSPYQLYTDVYTPRHVFGFNNVIRGEQHLGPRVIEYYDRWAQNLTPALAAQNVAIRWLGSWLWTFDLLPSVVTTIVALGMLVRWDYRWSLVGASIVSMHAFHVPYWYVGIMGWHYVFETAPLWCLFLGAATTNLVSGWRKQGRSVLVIWWYVFLAISIAGVYFSLGAKNRSDERTPSRFQDGLSSIAYPRRVHAEFRRWLEENVSQRPALVLLEQGAMENGHLDLVVNDPGLNSEILLGRFRAGVTDPAQVLRDFPDRHLYIVNPEQRTIKRVE